MRLGEMSLGGSILYFRNPYCVQFTPVYCLQLHRNWKICVKKFQKAKIMLEKFGEKKEMILIVSPFDIFGGYNHTSKTAIAPW